MSSQQVDLFCATPSKEFSLVWMKAWESTKRSLLCSAALLALLMVLVSLSLALLFIFILPRGGMDCASVFYTSLTVLSSTALECHLIRVIPLLLSLELHMEQIAKPQTLSPVDQCSPIKRHPPKFRQGNGDLFDTLCNHYKLPPQNCHHHLCGQTSGLFMEKINIQLSQYKNMKRSMNKYKTDPPFAVLLRYFFNNTLTNMRSQMNPMGAALHH